FSWTGRTGSSSTTRCAGSATSSTTDSCSNISDRYRRTISSTSPSTGRDERGPPRTYAHRAGTRPAPGIAVVGAHDRGASQNRALRRGQDSRRTHRAGARARPEADRPHGLRGPRGGVAAAVEGHPGDEGGLSPPPARRFLPPPKRQPTPRWDPSPPPPSRRRPRRPPHPHRAPARRPP